MKRTNKLTLRAIQLFLNTRCHPSSCYGVDNARGIFQNSQKVGKYLGYFYNTTLSPNHSKNSPIWSHCLKYTEATDGDNLKRNRWRNWSIRCHEAFCMTKCIFTSFEKAFCQLRRNVLNSKFTDLGNPLLRDRWLNVARNSHTFNHGALYLDAKEESFVCRITSPFNKRIGCFWKAIILTLL